MNIDSIKNGIVIDHITAGCGMKLYELLGLNELEVSIALIKNAQSKKIGKKDIIKIDADVKIDCDIVGYVSPNATIDIIKDGVLVEKILAKAPKRITNVVTCKNPHCITSTEQELDNVFVLADEKEHLYRCLYCEAKVQ